LRVEKQKTLAVVHTIYYKIFLTVAETQVNSIPKTFVAVMLNI